MRRRNGDGTRRGQSRGECRNRGRGRGRRRSRRGSRCRYRRGCRRRRRDRSGGRSCSRRRRRRRRTRRRRRGSGRRCGRGRGCRDRRSGRRSRRAGWQEAQRIEVAVLVLGPADAEMDVRPFDLCVGAGSDRADARALDDGLPLGDGGGAEVRQRDGVAVGCRDREDEPVARHPPHERHVARRGRARGSALRTADVDATVLTACIRIGAEGERPQHRAVRGPTPRARTSGQRERECSRCDDDPGVPRSPTSAHVDPSPSPPFATCSLF